MEDPAGNDLHDHHGDGQQYDAQRALLRGRAGAVKAVRVAIGVEVGAVHDAGSVSRCVRGLAADWNGSGLNIEPLNQKVNA
jgi:hypothetical protein